MNRAHITNLRIIIQLHVPGQAAVIANLRVISHDAIVSNMHAITNPVVVTHQSHAGTLNRAAMNRSVVAEMVAIAND
ncbi:hypothetical protein D3C75_1315700 [compost metagenome]